MALLILYQLRVLERRLGTAKYFVFVVFALVVGQVSRARATCSQSNVATVPPSWWCGGGEWCCCGGGEKQPASENRRKVVELVGRNEKRGYRMVTGGGGGQRQSPCSQHCSPSPVPTSTTTALTALHG